MHLIHSPAVLRGAGRRAAALLLTTLWVFSSLACGGTAGVSAAADGSAAQATAAAADADHDPLAEGPDAYRLGTGDRVRVTVFGHPDLSGEFDVDGAGNLSLPLIRLVEASGLSTRELEALIAAKLQPDYLRNPRVSVDVLSYRPFYILGEVRNPGSYPFVSNMTVLNAVAVAGGYSYRASKKKMTIVRATDPEKEKRPISESTRVYPGDVIEVPERFF